MAKRSCLVKLFCLVGFLVWGGHVAGSEESPYWQQYVHYKIKVQLDTRAHMLTGQEEILYRNNSPDTLRMIYLYLYPNAFRNGETVYSRETRRFYRRNPTEGHQGWIEIEEMSFAYPGGAQPEQVAAFKVDDTILSAKLPEPLAPGDEIVVRLKFREKVRKHLGRAGYRGNQYDFAQWYPKVVVYDEKGWHPEPFHAVGEFYGEFGTFDVTITVPFDYVVGATGVVVDGDPGWDLVRVDTTLAGKAWEKRFRQMKEEIRRRMAEGDTLRTVTFHAENVHDFAWSTSSDFLYERGEWDGIPIHVLYRSRAKSRWSKVVTKRAARALEWLSTKFGRYPYPQLTVIHGLLGGGMEYPMLVMNSSESEGLILHEVGHIYFYGALANNEQAEAWLDEGFTTFQTRWYMRTRYGNRRTSPGPRRGLASLWRGFVPNVSEQERTVNNALDYIESGLNEPISRTAYRFREPYSYRINAYTKGSLFYEMLQYVVGDSVWDRICHEYFKRWKFKHVNEMRFKQVCEDVSGMDLDWFFDEWLHDTVQVDYALAGVEKRRLPDGRWETVVRVKRLERGVMPVEVEVVTRDGERVTQRWFGRAREGQLRFVTNSRVERVRLDPRDRILDRNRLNNGTVKLAVYPFFLPLRGYPRDEYVVQWKPSGWYNDLDGLRFGLRARGSYRGKMRNVEVGAWYGIRSRALDARVRLSGPFRALGEQARFLMEAAKLEGRTFAEWRINWRWGRYITLPPHHQLGVGLQYSDLFQAGYAVREVSWNGQVRSFPDWDPERQVRAVVSYRVDPRGAWWDAAFNLTGELGKQLEGRKARYAKLSGELSFRPDTKVFDVGIRLFGGTAFGDVPPLQDLYWIEGANPRERFQRFYLRSRGAFPPEFPVHMAGGGNVRGYVGRPLAGKRMAAVNLEIAKDLGRVAPRALPVMLRVQLAAFYDAGQVWLVDTGHQRLSDAGLGLRFRSLGPGGLWGLRLDFPVWLSDPGRTADGKPKSHLGFRWLVGFDRVL